MPNSGRFIRKSTWKWLIDPIFITTEPDNNIRCSYNVTDGVGTETATVLAGDDIGFGVSASLVCRGDRGH